MLFCDLCRSHRNADKGGGNINWNIGQNIKLNWKTLNINRI